MSQNSNTAAWKPRQFLRAPLSILAVFACRDGLTIREVGLALHTRRCGWKSAMLQTTKKDARCSEIESLFVELQVR